MLSSTGYKTTFALANLDIPANLLHGVLINDRSNHRTRLRYIAHGQLSGLLDDLPQDLVIYLVDNDGTRAGRTLLTLETKSRSNYTGRGSVEISRFIDDHRVFAAHFQDGAFQPALPLLMFRRQFIDAQANIA